MKLSEKLSAAYFFFQGIAGALWWAGLFRWPRFRRLFLPEEFPDAVLLSLIGADLLFVVGSFAAAVSICQNRHQIKACCFLSGALMYATLTCWGWTISTGEAISGSVLMTLSLAGTLLAAANTRGSQ